jgi:hypothetical protein
MARKMRIPKAKQIVGLRKALRNPNTPKQFRASLKKRLAKLGAAAVAILALCGCAARPAIAQTPVIIQPTQQTLVSGAACTGSAQTYPVKNKNQTQHYVSISVAAPGVVSLSAEIDGIDSSSNVFVISDPLILASGGSTVNAILDGTGYYPQIQIKVTCVGNGTPGGLYSVNYSGSTGTFNSKVGQYQSTQVDKFFLQAASAGSAATFTFRPPFSSSSGYLLVTYGGAGPANSTINVQCQNLNAPSDTWTFNLATTTGLIQSWPVPIAPCSSLFLQYLPGGASANTINLEYVFQQPGQANSTLSLPPVHITGTTATAVKTTSGTLTAINLNTSGAGTISVFDLATAACTGTPATNIVAVLTIAATEIARQIPFNAYFQNGICVKASAAMDLTVGYQ